MTRNPFSDVIRSILLWRIWIRLGIRDVRLRFRRSAIGVVWIFLNLTIMVLAVGFIYGSLFKQEISKFLPLLTVSIIFWTYLTTSIVGGGNALIASEGYIKQIGLPIYVYVFRFFVNTLLTALISLAAYVVIVLVYRVQISPGILWFIPGFVLLALISLLTITIFAFLNTRFRDVSHLATSLMQVMFYLTPVIWPAKLLRERGLGSVIDWNPFYHILEIVRQPLLFSQPAVSQ
jgi:ABC-type polysaccharide/polyol phosphate export permease